MDFGEKIGGFNLLNAPDYLYRGSEEFWIGYNRPFLDKAIERGDDISLATKPKLDILYNKGQLTGFGREIAYLKSKGYRYDRKTNRMIK